MRIEIVRNNTGLQRERWVFNLCMGTTTVLYFDNFIFETKETPRHKWNNQSYYDRLMRRSSNIDMPAIPLDVIARVKEQICKTINDLLITY